VSVPLNHTARSHLVVVCAILYPDFRYPLQDHEHAVGTLRTEAAHAADVAQANCRATVAEMEARKVEEAATVLRESEQRHAEVIVACNQFITPSSA
jgi:hypothetical protein